MKPFLQQIAEIYSTDTPEQLIDTCFVFPNRRSGTFFRKHLRNSTHTEFIEPRIATLNELVAEHSMLTEADRNESLFVLYNSYSKLSKEIPNFDRFLFWGSMLLDDFNEVDNNLADATSLFVNVERWKEIKADYLTAEQKEIIKRYWGENYLNEPSVDNFWLHTLDESDEITREQFLRLWEILDPLYADFTSNMKANGIATRGMLFRETCQKLKHNRTSVFDLPHYVFIGFDFPTIAELTIFETLRDENRAEFYWDFNSPIMHTHESPTVGMMRRLQKYFPAKRKLDEAPIKSFGDIEIVAVPSETAQAREINAKLAEWVADKSIKAPEDPIDTAIVLPDEGLFVPLVESIPETIKSMNVTMGFPSRLTPIAGLMGMLLSLHMRSRRRKNTPREFYYKDVEDIIANPLVRMVAKEDCDKLQDHIRNHRLYTIAADTVGNVAPNLCDFFFDGDILGDSSTAHNYIDNLLSKLSSTLDPEKQRLQQIFIDSFRDANDNLYHAVERHGIDMEENTFLNLLERITDSEQINFEGKPLSGLQIMGVLETRSLDFDNVVISSMNEKVFPKKATKKSFIPDSIRIAYGLPSSDFPEKKYAFFFFRFLARAKKVLLTYDNRTSGLKSGEISRFIMQLLYLYPSKNVRHVGTFFQGAQIDVEPIELPKTPLILAELEKFKKPLDEGGRALSASTLKTYLTCPLKFCLSKVLKLEEDDEIEDFMEASTFGTIVHEVAEKLYGSLGSGNKPIEVLPRNIEGWLSNPVTIQREIVKSINFNYNNLPEEELLTPLNGELEVIGKAIERIIIEILRHDLTLAPFTFVGAEIAVPTKHKVNNDTTVNFSQVIDRVDIVDGKLRIVDYKTGNERTDLGGSTIAKLFERGNDNDLLSVFQVFLYCILYRDAKNWSSAIQPYIYELRHILTKGINPLTIGVLKSKRPIDNYQEFAEEFEAELNRLIEEIFDPKIGFKQTRGKKDCTFCHFKSICGRSETKPFS